MKNALTKELKKAVVKEALLLREYATVEEKKKLCLSILDGRDSGLCVYGQMTGSCNTPRAIQLLKVCAIPYTRSNNYLSGQIYEFERFEEGYRGIYSAIEMYICQDGAKIEDLINLIKS